MIWFVLAAIAMTAVALGFVIHPLLCATPKNMPSSADNLHVLRDQVRELQSALNDGTLSGAAHAEASEELARRVNTESVASKYSSTERPSRVMAGLIACIVPLIAAGLYNYAGSPAAIAVANPNSTISAPQHEITAADVSTLVQGLADRMRKDPTNADGWYMLARSYTAIGRYQDAVQAYQRLVVLVPDDSAVLADYADVLATVQGSLSGEPEELVLQALKHNPGDIKALALAGNAAYQRGEIAAAQSHWRRLLPLVPRDSALYQGTVASLAEIDRKIVGGNSAKLAGAGTAGSESLTGTVSIAPQLKAQIAPTDSVFIFARAAQGTRTPLAVKRLNASQLPFKFVLDDSQAMSPELKLSSATNVVVTARVSKSGSANRKPEDLEGQIGPIPSSSKDISLQIDTVVR